MASIFSKTQSRGYTDTGGYNTAKPTYKSPITKPAEAQQTREGGAYAEYMKELQAIQQQRQEEYNRIMQDRANALVKWQQEQAALRAQEQMGQYGQAVKPSWQTPGGAASTVSGSQGWFAGKPLSIPISMDYSLGSVYPTPYGETPGVETGGNRPAAGSLGTANRPAAGSLGVANRPAAGQLGRIGYEGSSIRQPSGNFDYENYPYPYTTTNMPTDPAVAEEEQGWDDWGGYPELPYYDYGGGWGGYDPYTDKPSYRNSVGGIYWRI
jgi:hypothetical protein